MKVNKIPQERFAEAREWFTVHGISISDWANQNNVDRNVLYAVLSGKSRCLRGEGHRIALLLGLKPVPAGEQDDESPAALKHEMGAQERKEGASPMPGLDPGRLTALLSAHG